MPDPIFDPDLLLVVGADITQLRQQLAQIGREMGPQAIQIRVGAEGTQQAKAGIDDTARSVKALQQEVDTLRKTQEAQARALKNDLRDQEQAYTRQRLEIRRGDEAAAAERTRINQRRDVELAKLGGDRVRIEQQRDVELAQLAGASAAERVKIEQRREVELAKLGGDRVRIEQQRDVELARIAGANAAERIRIEQRRDIELATLAGKSAAERTRIEQKRDLDVAKLGGDRVLIQQRRDVELATSAVKAAREEVRVTEAKAAEIIRIERQLATERGRLQAMAARVERVSASPITRGSPAFQAQAAETLGAIRVAQQTNIAGGTLGPTEIQNLANSSAALTQQMGRVKEASAAAHGSMSTLFDRFGRYVQIAGLLTVTYAGLNAVFSAVDQIKETDKTLRLIESTAERGADKIALLRSSYELMVEGNQVLGKSFKETGAVVFELQKALDGNVEQIRGAFLPALILASTGEGNQAQIVKTLIGAYELFGDTLGAQLTPMEKYTKISDSLLGISIATIPSIEDFRGALSIVAPAARSANVSLDATLSLLAVLQQGMQGASRSGTGLARLLKDISEDAPRIGKIFDIPIDINKPVNVLNVLLEVTRKIRDAGPQTIQMSNQIKQAFGDERAERALQTLVELLPKFSSLMERAGNSAGQTAASVKILGGTLEAALGRLSGTAFDQLNRILADLQGVDPGKADGVVTVLNGISLGIERLGTAIRNSGGVISSFFGSLKDLSKGDLEGIESRFGGLGARLGSALGKNASEEEKKRYRSVAEGLGFTFGPPDKNSIESRAAAEAPFKSEFFYELKPIIREHDLRGELAAAVARIREQAQTAIDRSNPYLDFEVRIRNANQEVARVQEEVERATKDFERNIFGKGGDRELAEKQLFAAYEKLGRAKLEVIKLSRDEAESGVRAARDIEREQIAATAAAQSLIKEISGAEEAITKLTLSNALENSFLEANQSAEQFYATVQKIRDARAIDLNLDTDKLRGLQGKLFDTPGLTSEQITIQYDRLDKLIAEKTRETQEKHGAATRIALLSEGEKTFREFEKLLAKATADDATSAELDKLSEKALGIDKLTDSIKLQRSVLGLWGPEIAQQTALAAHGFASLEHAIEEFDRTGNPAVGRLITAIGKLGEVSRDKSVADLKTQIDEQSKSLDAARGAYGLVGAEAAKYAIALKLNLGQYKDLKPEEQALIDRLAKMTEGFKQVAAVSGLVKLGFSEPDAERIAQQTADTVARQRLIQDGIEQMRVLNDAGEVARQQQEAFIQESSRATGDFVTFFTSKMRDAANTGADFWTLMGTLAEDTSRAMSSSLSDFFFDTFTGKLQTTGQLWSNFLTGMHRSLSDFMSKQLVRSFLNILTGTAGGEGGGSPTGGLIGSGSASALGGVIGGFGNLFQNAQAGGVSGSLFGLPPVPPSTVNVGLPPSSPDLEFAGFAPTSMYLAGRPATSGLIGTGGQASKELSSAGAILAAYTAAQSVIKLTSEISSEQDRNSGTGGLVGAGVGGAIGAFFGSTAIGAGAGGLLGSYLGGLFGSDAPPAGRFDEINRTISAVQSSLEAMITSSKSFTSLFNTLLSAQGGGSLAASSGAPVQLAVGGRNISGLTQSEFLSAVRANPSSLSASVQAGVNPSLLSGLNQEVVNAVLARIAALDQIGQQINETIADILAETVVPVPTGATSLETLKQQAVDFRAVVDQLIATNAAQTQALETQLAATTDPELVLQYTTTIKGLIEKRYQDETQLVQKFAGQLDSLATSLKNVSSSIEKQIFDLQLSNFGPTNPLAGLQLAQGKFDAAKAAFNANPTPENAQALQALVDPLLKSASEVFTRPSPEYRAIFNDVIGTLEEVKGAVDSQANDIGDALAAALGTSNSLQDLTQKNTAAMAADMKQLLAIVTASAAASGINLNAGTGILLPGTFPTQGQPVQPYQDTSTAGTGNQTAAGLTAAGVMGLLGSSGTAATSIIGLADKLGLTTWLKDSLGSLFTTTDPAINPATAANYYTGGGSDVGLVAPALPTFTIPEITIPNITLNLPDNFSYVGESYSFSDIGTGAYSPDYGSLAFQSGGHVPGAGSGDTVPAMLEPGEFVIPRRVAGPLRPFLENLIGGQKNIPTGPHGLHFATGGTVPFTAQDVQALLLLQALLGVNNNQIQTQQQIASNTQLTADILRQLAQRSGLSVAGSSMAAPTTPNLTVLSASPSGGLSLSSTPVPSTASPAPSSPAPSSPVPAGPQGTGTPSEFQSTLNSGKFGLQAVASAANVLGYQGVAQSAVGLAGLLSLYQGIQQGNPYLAAGGGLTAAQSLAGILSQPGVAQTLGLTPNQATWLGIVSQGLGAATGAVGVVQGIQQGNYLQAGAGGVQTLGSVANILANPKIADFLGYGSGPLINQAGQFTPTLGGALGVAGGALGVVGGGLNIYQGIQSGSAAQIASGAYSTVLGASAISGAFGGPTLASLAAGVAPAATSAGTAATTAATAGISAITPAAATVGYIALPVAIALGIWAHQEAVEAAKKRSGILEGLSIRSAYAEAVPTILDSMRGVNDLAAISLMPGQQQTEALLSLRARLESGWAGLADVSHFISTKGVGTQQAISTIGRADTTQAELIARVGTPIIAAGLAQVYDALALRGQPVFGGAMQPTSNYDIAAILNANSAFAGVDPVKFQQALLAGQFAGILSNTAPGDFSSTIGAIFTANNPQFSQSSFGTALGLEPIAAPTGTDAAMVQQQMMASLAQRQESIAQTREYVQQTGDYSPISAIAPYVPGGTETLIRDALPAWGLNEYEVTRVLGPDALRTMTLMQIKSVMDALQQSTGSNYGMAAGGWVSPTEVRQPAWGRDTVLRLLEPGEFIVPSQIARANAGLLEGLISDGAVRSDYGSTISTAARSGDYRSAGGISQVALNIHPGAIQIDGAKDPRAVSREVLDTIEQNIRTGRLGHVIVTRVRQTRG